MYGKTERFGSQLAAMPKVPRYFVSEEITESEEAKGRREMSIESYNAMCKQQKEITSLRQQLAAANAEIERLKEWKQLGGEYADCLQKLCMDRLYDVCKPISHKWPGRKHTDTIVEGVEFLLSEIARLRKIEAAAHDFNAVMLRESLKEDPDERAISNASIKFCNALAGEGGGR